MSFQESWQTKIVRKHFIVKINGGMNASQITQDFNRVPSDAVLSEIEASDDELVMTYKFIQELAL